MPIHPDFFRLRRKQYICPSVYMPIQNIFFRLRQKQYIWPSVTIFNNDESIQPKLSPKPRLFCDTTITQNTLEYSSLTLGMGFMMHMATREHNIIIFRVCLLFATLLTCLTPYIFMIQVLATKRLIVVKNDSVYNLVIRLCTTKR